MERTLGEKRFVEKVRCRGGGRRYLGGGKSGKKARGTVSKGTPKERRGKMSKKRTQQSASSHTKEPQCKDH